MQVAREGVAEGMGVEVDADALAEHLESVPDVLLIEPTKHFLGGHYSGPCAVQEGTQGLHAWFSKGYGTLVAALALETNSVPL
jgi:hypothetical protein